MIKLKPCPFCGNENLLLFQINDTEWVVKCENCDAWGPERDFRYDAAVAWNMRKGEKENEN